MPRFLLLACASALAAALPSPALASGVTRAQVLEAIRAFEANATGADTPGRAAEAADAVAKASNTILKFAIESDDVVVDLGPNAVTWCDVKKGIADMPHSGERGLLLAAYLSGCVKAQLASGRQDANPFEGWVAMLRLYRAMKMREDVTIPEADSLLSRQMDGTLREYAASALARSTEALRKAYGDKPASTGLAGQP
jgi:hypothetical protein